MLIVIDLGFVRMMEGFSLLLDLLLPCGMLLAEASIMSSPSFPHPTRNICWSDRIRIRALDE